MTDDASTPPDPEHTSPESGAAPTEAAPATAASTAKDEPQADAAPKAPRPGPSKRAKGQAILVWLGIACLLAGAYVGWRAAERKKWFRPIAHNLHDPVIREGQILNEWAGMLRENGGPTCQAIADMLTSEEIPPLLKERDIAGLDDLARALREGGELLPICEAELTGSWNVVAWSLAVAGVGLIALDVLRERGMLPGRAKPRSPANQ